MAQDSWVIYTIRRHKMHSIDIEQEIGKLIIYQPEKIKEIFEDIIGVDKVFLQEI